MTRAAAPQLALVLVPGLDREAADAAEAPLARLLDRGGEALTDAELLAVLLDEEEPRRASELLERAGGLAGLPALEGLLARGPREPEIAPLRAAVELARRMARAELPERRILSRPAQVASYLHLRFAVAGQEVMGALFLDPHQRLIADREYFRGAIARASVEARPILRDALASDAFAVLLFHTHPSGDPAPSREDLAFTRRFEKAGEHVGVKLVDHLIVGNGGRWVSLKDRGGW
jgi:DNA repair protein RadC